MFESEEELVARLEAEERARLEFEDAIDGVEDGLQPHASGEMKAVASTDETEEEMRKRIEEEERSKKEPERVGIAVVATRFARAGAFCVGGREDQVAMLQAQPWRSESIADASFTRLAAHVRSLPGPSILQLAAALGLLQGGPLGGVIAGFSFSAPSALTMAALGSIAYASSSSAQFVPGRLGGVGALLAALQMGVAAAAVALSARAAVSVSGSAVTTPMATALSLTAAAVALLAPATSSVMPLALILAGVVSACTAAWAARRGADDEASGVRSNGGLLAPDGGEGGGGGGGGGGSFGRMHVGTRAACGLLALWLLLLAVLWGWEAGGAPGWVAELASHYRTAALLVGGDAVALPLLFCAEVPRRVSSQQLLQAYALAHALPGPLVPSLSAYVGGAYAGPAGALLAWLGAMLPSLLLLHAALPLWAAPRVGTFAALTARLHAGAMLQGARAAASGLVLAGALLVLAEADAPPQHAAALLAFAAHHQLVAAGPARVPLLGLGARRHASQLIVLLGAVLGLVLCLPWLLSGGEEASAGTGLPAQGGGALTGDMTT